MNLYINLYFLIELSAQIMTSPRTIESDGDFIRVDGTGYFITIREGVGLRPIEVRNNRVFYNNTECDPFDNPFFTMGIYMSDRIHHFDVIGPNDEMIQRGLVEFDCYNDYYSRYHNQLILTFYLGGVYRDFGVVVSSCPFEFENGTIYMGGIEVARIGVAHYDTFVFLVSNPAGYAALNTWFAFSRHPEQSFTLTFLSCYNGVIRVKDWNVEFVISAAGHHVQVNDPVVSECTDNWCGCLLHHDESKCDNDFCECESHQAQTGGQVSGQCVWYDYNVGQFFVGDRQLDFVVDC